MSGYFVTGTDTGVGKTLISAAILRAFAETGKKVVGMKPVASGCRMTENGLRNEDAESLIAQSSISASYEIVNPYAFEPAIAPHLAARDAGIRIELETILDRFESLTNLAEMVVVEGVGGWCVPLGRVITTEDMAKALNLPVILVVGVRLGCLNHALLSAQAIKLAGLELAGWVANQLDTTMERMDELGDSLSERIDAPLLGRIPCLEKVTPDRVMPYLHLDQILKS